MVSRTLVYQGFLDASSSIYSQERSRLLAESGDIAGGIGLRFGGIDDSDNRRSENAKPAEKNYKLADSGGLFLLVTKNGAKSWRYKYRFGVKEKLLTLGLYPDVGLVAARELRDEARKLVRAGRDPALEAQKKRDADIDAANATFRKQAEEWMADQAPVWSPSHAVRVRNRIERDLYPMFGHRPIGDVDSSIVLRALRKIEARGSIETAKRVRGYVFGIFKRAKAERMVTMNTVMEIDEIKDALKPARPGMKQPALTTIPELLELQLTVDRSTANTVTKLASRLKALTLVGSASYVPLPSRNSGASTGMIPTPYLTRRSGASRQNA